ncbi:SDR family oxidoreductase [Helcobacillus massiliensis]|uniref:NAD(P)-dependent dehydrogenase (Short-subunit alcohol dehydrogenase family) n=1 Tax=Helcobacillus massiliensis TaxID=521392 RepID=A0A839QTH3_9MICO|nr:MULTISPECIES: SDR family oxidoreductase [Helcobacillus]MBB3022060.1 NAD(P)-dependent dehydrogenase (short-subunit alcohol dehydrogenase family) [Helcobacillus massiliensis]MCG7427743.1 SDR family oxidoreductase [Helcobacillus sp. ACRRO]MCT1557411.1 SDR family oxidoreductase [Helcobacillus massiliensis]MCT2036408.1 SDR family oxidoreductase [Helcobacillus massiliensis]MCT2331850.1 SDR family oxidoreductase [Helcobacillus massiliensis]
MNDQQNLTAVITGSSRGVGADTAKLLAGQGFNVVVNYREKAPRANKVVQQIEEAGGRAIAVGADLTKPEDVKTLMQSAVDEFGSLDLLVLNASGGMEKNLGEDYALRLNRDAQVGALTTALPLMQPGSRVVFVTSHQAHFINDVETMAEYHEVAKSKRAGEDALTAMVPEMKDQGVSFVVVSGDMIEGTVTATLLNRAQPGALESRREAAGRLYSVAEFAEEIVAMATADVETGHVELVGGAEDFLAQVKK